MKNLTYLATLGLMFTSGTALAQDATTSTLPTTVESQAADPMTEGTSDMTQAAPMEAEEVFTDIEIENYAQAAMQIQTLQEDGTTDNATIQAEAPAILASAGLDAETFNAITDAVQTDPETAERVMVAMSNLQADPSA